MEYEELREFFPINEGDHGLAALLDLARAAANTSGSDASVHTSGSESDMTMREVEVSHRRPRNLPGFDMGTA